MEKNIPYVLYHYTSLNVLEQILTNKTIRLSDITKTNDSKEITWIKNIIEEEYPKAYCAEKAQYFKKYISYEDWIKLSNYLTQKWFDIMTNKYAYYVCCLSTQRDLLSQWRGYGNDAKGIAIGFNYHSLAEMTKILPDTHIAQVDYGKVSQRTRVREEASLLISNIKEFLKTNIEKDKVLEEKVGISEEVKGMFDGSFQKLYKMAVEMKNPFFREESEIRICRRVDKSLISNTPRYQGPYVEGEIAYFDAEHLYNPDNKDAYYYPISYWAKDNMITSYTDLCFKNFVKKDINIIRSIWLGPKCHVNENDMKGLFVQHGFGDVIVEQSKGTYV